MDPARFRSSGRSAGGRLFSVAMAKAMAKAMTMAFAIVAVLSIGCRSQSGDDQPAGTPVASFTSSATGGTPPLTVQFTDTSTGEITGYLWDLGNGTTSTEANPVVTYPDIGVYPVSLTVTGGRGSSTSGVQEIGVADPPTAGFSCTPDIAFAPLATTCTSSAVGATSGLRASKVEPSARVMSVYFWPPLLVMYTAPSGPTAEEFGPPPTSATTSVRPSG